MGIHKEESTGTVVDFTAYKGQRETQIDEWLDDQVAEQYGDKDEITVKNPTLRLMTLYDTLEGEKKSEFYGYVRRTAESMMGERIRREQFWTFMKAVSDAWEDLEEYGKRLVAMDGKGSRSRKCE